MFRLFEAGVIWQTRSEEISLSTMPIGLKLDWTVSLPLPGLIRSVGRVAMGFQSVPEHGVSDRRISRQYSGEEGMLLPPPPSQKIVRMAGSRVCHPLATWRVETGCRSRYLPCPAGVGCATTRSPMQGAVSTRLQNGLGRAGKRKPWPCINSSLTGRRVDAAA